MDHKNSHISSNRQRQTLSIAVIETACQGPSHEAFDRAVFSIKKPPTLKNKLPVPEFGEVITVKPEPPPPSYILDVQSLMIMHSKYYHI